MIADSVVVVGCKVLKVLKVLKVCKVGIYEASDSKMILIFYYPITL